VNFGAGAKIYAASCIRTSENSSLANFVEKRLEEVPSEYGP
jgi:hypothetical protein